ncbi:MAG: hypothetical protein GX318_00295 [Clostridia bacterium]|nr:hypothetical protein [Clostridia bacterium]
MREFGSQGQQRLTVLSMKLAEMNFIQESTEQYPLLLMDDVMSELDAVKRSLLLDNLKHAQTFITATEREYFSEDFLENTALWTVNNGNIERKA